MNQNGFDPRNGQGAGQPNAYPAGGYNGGAAGYPAGAYGTPGNAQGYMPQGGYAPGAQTGQMMPGYGQAPYAGAQTGQTPAGYGQAPAGYGQAPYAGVTGYSSYAPYAGQAQSGMAAGYPPPGGATGVPGTYFPGNAAGQVSQGYPPANPLMQGYPPRGASAAPSTGSFIPQTPYSTAGYPPAAPGGAQGGGVPGGTGSAYAQMGRAPQKTASHESIRDQVPINGGGYVPQYVPVKKRAAELPAYALLAAGGVLIVLFVLAVMVLNNTALKILLLVLAAGTTAYLWIRPVTESNNRLCYSVIAAVLCFITAVSFIPFNRGGNSAADVTNTPGSPAAQSSGGSSLVVTTNVPAGYIASATVETTPTVEETEDIQEVTGRVYSLFQYWQGNRLEEMLELCSPSWRSKLENPRTELFTILRNRTPTDIFLENITGTSADTSRKVILTSSINRNDGNPPVKYRMTVLMSKENGEWYVDPESLRTNEKIETPDPSITEAPTPSPTPYTDANTVLYYNPNGGEMYHRDPNCRTVHANYTPLQGHFNFSQINDPPYSELKPCTVCGSPLR